MGLLRLILALAVVFQHSPWNGGLVFVGGRNAVQMFYMISGFLICHVLKDESAYPRVADFYRSRVLRLLPVYYVVLLVSLASAPWINPELFSTYSHIPASAKAMLVAANALVFGQDWVMFSGITDGRLVAAADFRASEVLLYKGLAVPQAWTLGVELTFYLVAPFVLRSRPRIWALLVFSIAVRLALVIHGVGRNDPWTYRFFPSELAFFLAGALADLYLLPLWTRWTAPVSGSPGHALLRRAPLLATALMVFVTATYFLIPVGGGIKSVVVFMLFLAALPLTFEFQNAHPLDRQLGELSYPVYVGHMLVVFCTEQYLASWRASHPLQVSLLNVAGALLLAVALNQWIGKPVERYRRRFRGKRAKP